MKILDYNQNPMKLSLRMVLLPMGIVIQVASWCEMPSLFDDTHICSTIPAGLQNWNCAVLNNNLESSCPLGNLFTAESCFHIF